MDILQGILQTILDQGPLLLLPLVFIALGLIFRVGVVRAFRSGITIGVSFAGLYLVLDYFVSTIGPAAERLSERFGGAFTYIDIGWGVFAGFAFASPIAYAIIGLSIVANLILLALGLTKTLNLNLWDLWEAIIAGLIVMGITGNTVAAVITGLVWGIIHLKIADFYSGHGYFEFYGLPGLTSFFVGGTTLGLVGHVLAKVLDRIPVLEKAQFTPDWIREKLGILGEPAFVGAILGILLGILAGLSWAEVLVLGVNVATVLIVLPMMVGMVMESLTPITDRVSQVLKERTKGRRDILVGVDIAIACGHEGVLAVTMVMVPVYILLALVLPGSRILPLADLSAIVYYIALILPTQRGDLLRTIIVTTLLSIGAVYLGAFTAPYQNMVAQNAGGVDVAEGVKVASWLNAYMPEYAISAWIGELLAPILP